MASAIGTALSPTQGSCLPVTSILISSPTELILWLLALMLEVGLIKNSISMGSPFEIPPKIPPALFEANPSPRISSLISDPLRSRI